MGTSGSGRGELPLGAVGEPGASAVEVLDPRARELARPGEALERLATGATWSEGPVWMHEDGSVLWSDIPANRMLRWHPDDGVHVWRDRVDFTNGHFRDHDGSLLHCSHGLRAIVRTRFAASAGRGSSMRDPDAVDEVVVDRYQGRRLNSPNDIVVKSDGTWWFTDPPYGILSDDEGHRAESELGRCYVFRFDPRSGTLEIASDVMEHPNGLAFSPDEAILYVSDTADSAQRDGSRPHRIVAFDVIDGRVLAGPRVLADISPGLPDGFRVDARGWIYTSSDDAVQVLHPDGTLIARIPVPERVGNVTFGGPQRNELFICATTSLYRIRLRARGVQAP